MRMPRWWCFLLVPVFIAGNATGVLAQEGKVVLNSRAPFARVAAALEQAIAEQRMGFVCHTDPQQAAATRGIKIAGNQLFMIFRNEFAVRLINADPRAAFEAPMRIYLYENRDGTATLTYARPSALLQPYPHPEVARVGAELDPIFDKIATQAIATR